METEVLVWGGWERWPFYATCDKDAGGRKWFRSFRSPLAQI